MTAEYVLISDLDDTLLGDDAALQRFADWYDGVRHRLDLVYSSGRFVSSIATSVQQTRLPDPVYVIGGVGTQICRYPEMKELPAWEQYLASRFDAERVWELLADEHDLEAQDPSCQSRFKVSYLLPDASTERLAQIERRLRDAGLSVSLVYSSRRDLDVLPEGVDKGAAAAFFVREMGYDHDHVLVSGNSYNDASLMRYGFNGIVVGNADPDLRQVASADGGKTIYQAHGLIADGVREGIEHWADLVPRLPRAATAAVDAGYDRAKALLHDCASKHGFIATTRVSDNYQRVWGRDSSIMMIAALLDGDPALVEAARSTLLTLAAWQGPQGQIPSNVDVDSNDVSYGGTTGRVDASLWFVIACACYWRFQRDADTMHRLAEPLQRVAFLLRCWEFNDRGLLYVPVTGDWADEYLHAGYVLYDQLLYLQAQRSLIELAPVCGFALGDDSQARCDRLLRLVRANYWMAGDGEPPEDAYHPVLYRKGLQAQQHRKRRFWLPFFSPAGYGYRFDAFANILAGLLDIGTPEQDDLVIAYIERLCSDRMGLVPAFAPVIRPRDEAWEDLQMMFSYEFKNAPYEYHNGGLWPMLTGFYVALLAQKGRHDQARAHVRDLHRANALNHLGNDWGFPEYINCRNGEAGGNGRMGWSAAAAIIGEQALRGQRIFP